MPRLPLIAALALACGPAPADPDPTSTTSTTASTTDASTTTATPTTTSDASTTADLSSTTLALDFPRDPDIFETFACDHFMQDCPPGQKCAPYAYGGLSYWNATKCVDITGDNKPGDPCTAPEGPTAGIEDCALGSLCYPIPQGTLEGTCSAQCSGSHEEPTCPEKHFCGIAAEGALAICYPTCDPLDDDCDVGELCISSGDHFRCFLDASGDEGQANDPCEFATACDPGLACIMTDLASSACDPSVHGCCQPFCKLPNAPCPNPDQQCVPWFFPRASIPDGLEDLGVCALPM